MFENETNHYPNSKKPDRCSYVFLNFIQKKRKKKKEKKREEAIQITNISKSTNGDTASFKHNKLIFHVGSTVQIPISSKRLEVQSKPKLKTN